MEKEKFAPENNTSATDGSTYHTAVLLNESVAALNIKPDGVYVDATFGGGGHSRAILAQLSAKGKLIVFDQDAAAAANLPKDERLTFIPQNFKYLQRFLRLQQINEVDGILADLGVSSHQFDEAERGFSTRFEADLDMRMDKRQSQTAATVIQNFSEAQLHKMFEKYGEVTNSKTLAKLIVDNRNTISVKTTTQFKQLLQPIVKGNPNKYFAQVFQALRIQVNEEMEALENLLTQSLGVLKTNGRLAVISFHSLEDRMVKNFMKQGSVEEVEVDEVFGGRPASVFKVITKKPVTATDEELKRNKRARSAKLRVAEKII